MSSTTAQFENIIIDQDRIFDMIDVDPRRIWCIYLYGSRVYNNIHRDSDWDFKVLASTQQIHTEYHDGEYNVHVWTPDKFQDDLWKYRMNALECIYAPKFARVLEKVDYREKFELDKMRLRKTVLSESHSAWIRGKMKILDGDHYRGTKSLYHSLRMLIFGLQIIEYDEIIDFSESNYYWEEIDNFQSVKWNEIKNEFLPKKKVLEDMIRE